MNDEIMFELNPYFQKEIFERIILKFNNSKNAGKALKIPSSSIRGYKNLSCKTIPERVLKYLVKTGMTNEKEIEDNLINKRNKKEIIKTSLEKGRESTKKKFDAKKAKIPRIYEIIYKNELDFTKWFLEYRDLLDSGFRKSKVKEKKNLLEVSYTNFNKVEIKEFTKNFPKKYLLNEEFSYFLGLWCGDKSGGKRFGVINQNKEILDFSENFLKKNFQKTERILYIGEKVEEPDLKFYKKIVIKGKEKGWAISVFSTNGILSSFFFYLLKNLEYLLKNSLNSEAFFAGLFDAEGNVSFYNKSFRWACKDSYLVAIYSKFLDKLGLYDRYDGSCLISYNREAFFKKVVPHLKNKDKIKDSYFLCKGSQEKIPKDFINILRYLKKNPLSTQKEVSKALKKSKVYSELGLLREFGFVVSESYPLRFKLNKEIKNISGD